MTPLEPDEYESCPLWRLTLYEFDDTFSDRLIRIEEGRPPTVVNAPPPPSAQPCHYLPTTRKYVERSVIYHHRACPNQPFDPDLIALLRVD